MEATSSDGRAPAAAEPGATGVITTFASADDRLLIVFSRQIAYINMSKLEAVRFAKKMLHWAERLPGPMPSEEDLQKSGQK